MLSSTLTLNGHDGADYVFNEVTPEKGGRQWIYAPSNLVESVYLGIRHSLSGRGPAAVDRHLTWLTYTLIGSDGKPYTGGVNITHIVPRNAVFTSEKARQAFAIPAGLTFGGAFSATTGFADTAFINNLLVGGS